MKNLYREISAEATELGEAAEASVNGSANEENENENESENKNDLEAIESQIIVFLKREKNESLAMARLMDRVEKEQLFKKKNYNSFAEWVSSLAARTNISERTIWRRLKVGRYFEGFLRDKRAQGGDEETLRALESAKISADSVELISKIAGSSEAIRNDLMEKMLDNNLTSAALRAAWKARRAQREEKNLPCVRTNGYQKPIDMDDMVNTDSNSDSSTESVKITSLDISLALASTADWLREWTEGSEGSEGIEGTDGIEGTEGAKSASETNSDRKRNFAKPKETYHVFPEFPVNTATTHHRARMDALIVENISLPLFEKSTKICLHCMEFKVDINDLKNDMKLWEYEVFADFSWLCIPPKLIEAAEEKLRSHPKWGILVIEKEKGESTGAYAVSVYRPAKHFKDIECSPDSSDEHSEAAHLWLERLQEYQAKRTETLMTVINRLANVPPTARAQSHVISEKNKENQDDVTMPNKIANSVNSFQPSTEKVESLPFAGETAEEASIHAGSASVPDVPENLNAVQNNEICPSPAPDPVPSSCASTDRSAVGNQNDNLPAPSQEGVVCIDPQGQIQSPENPLFSRDDILNVAAYLGKRYNEVSGLLLDEKKVQKLLYLMQRVSIHTWGDATFAGDLKLWTDEPVSLRVYKAFKYGTISSVEAKISPENEHIADCIIRRFGSLNLLELQRAVIAAKDYPG